MEIRDKRVLLQALEMQKSYIKDVWKLYVKKVGGRADEKALEFYSFLQTEATETIIELQKGTNAFNHREE